MKRDSGIFATALICLAGLLPSTCVGQSGEPLPKFGISLNAGTLGAGIQAATSVTRKSNVRFGFSYFSYGGSLTSSKNNIAFDGTLRLESAEVFYDQYIGKGFHISPGVAIYDGNRATGNASVPAGQTFKLNNVNYYSAAGDPVTGTGSFTSGTIAPEFLLGFGNLLPRSARHFTANFDLGVIFTRSPIIKLNLIGSACINGPTSGCLPISGDPLVQANLQAEQTRLNHDTGSYLKYWPVIRLGFGYKF
jgi:hypothetical protein